MSKGYLHSTFRNRLLSLSRVTRTRAARQATFILESGMAERTKPGAAWGAMGELALIERIRARSAASGGASGVRLGIGDDCAVLRVPAGHDTVVTTDFTLERRHFRRDWHSPESAGHRCLARGLSDVAAMGAKPIAAFLSLALPAEYEVPWLDRFLHGLTALAERHGVVLAGGDTAQAPGPEVLADIVCVGSVRRGRALLRSGARVGDRIYVTGTLGGAAAELAALAAGALCATEDRGGGQPQSFPQPRVAAGRALAGRRLATSCMDLSDGISSDLAQLCRASGCDAELNLQALPLGVGATLAQALGGGEDYELLFTAAAGTRIPRRIGGVGVTAVGTMVARRGDDVAVWADGQRLEASGWEHLGGRASG
jgi:thiamine-monophosphate kinase